jgi:hypothetical protein
MLENAKTRISIGVSEASADGQGNPNLFDPKWQQWQQSTLAVLICWEKYSGPVVTACHGISLEITAYHGSISAVLVQLGGMAILQPMSARV